MTRRRLIVGAFLLALLALLFWWNGRAKPVAVAVHEIDLGVVESTLVNTRAGTVEACRRTRLSTIVGGRIETLAVKEGEHVRKGQLLLKLWNDDQQAQSKLAQTQVESARRHVGEICVRSANAGREAQRQASLHAKGFVSSAAEEAALAQAQSLRAACEASEADVTQAKARVDAVVTEQRRTVLYAPFDGTVAKIVGEVGEYSTPSPPGVPTPSAIDLIDESCLYVSAPMDEVDAPKIRAGQMARIHFDALPKQSFPGRIRRVAPFVTAVEKQSRTVEVEADFERSSVTAPLLVGNSADVEVVLATREKVVRVPTSAVQEGSKVLLAGSDGRLIERIIKTGIANWEYTEVLDGLRAGDRVVTSLEREGVKPGVRYVADHAANQSNSPSQRK